MKEARHHLCDSICVKLKRRQNESDRDQVRRCLRAEMYWLERRLKETSRIGNVSCLDLVSYTMFTKVEIHRAPDLRFCAFYVDCPSLCKNANIM